MRAAVRRALAATQEVRRYALVDPDGDDTDTRASALRARGMIVALRSADLRRLNRNEGRYQPIGRFSTLDACIEFLLGEIGKINATWIAEVREAVEQHVWEPDETIVRAESAYVELGRDLDVIAVLEWGVRSESPVIRSSCRDIAGVLDVRLPVPDLDDEVPAIPSLSRPRTNVKPS
ncbi:MAG: hypothetical protein QM831_43940 [Kofleriaceae bacterium]